MTTLTKAERIKLCREMAAPLLDNPETYTRGLELLDEAFALEATLPPAANMKNVITRFSILAPKFDALFARRLHTAPSAANGALIGQIVFLCVW